MGLNYKDFTKIVKMTSESQNRRLRRESEIFNFRFLLEACTYFIGWGWGSLVRSTDIEFR